MVINFAIEFETKISTTEYISCGADSFLVAKTIWLSCHQTNFPTFGAFASLIDQSIFGIL